MLTTLTTLTSGHELNEMKYSNYSIVLLPLIRDGHCRTCSLDNKICNQQQLIWYPCFVNCYWKKIMFLILGTSNHLFVLFFEKTGGKSWKSGFIDIFKRFTMNFYFKRYWVQKNTQCLLTICVMLWRKRKAVFESLLY